MSPLRWLLVLVLLGGAGILAWLMLPLRAAVDIPPGMSSEEPGMAERGAYLVRAAGCVSCHWDRKGRGKPFAGGRQLITPFGVFVAPNISGDRRSGIGAWSDEEFVRALIHGQGVHGEELYPVFPYTTYTRMTVEDALAIKAYLVSLAPVPAGNEGHDLSFPFSWRALLKGWKLLYFSGEPLPYDPNRSSTWNRGRYLVDALGHCGECHTPRGDFGQMDEKRYLQGNPHGPDGWKIPALVGPRSQLAEWSVEEIEEYLNSGAKPDFDSAQGPMAEVIEDSSKHLTEEDQNAIALYLKSLNRR